MIQTENIVINNRTYVRTWSDAGVYIHGGFPEGNYSDATDPADSGRVYVETDIPLPTAEDAEISDSEALSIITAGEAGKGGTV